MKKAKKKKKSKTRRAIERYLKQWTWLRRRVNLEMIMTRVSSRKTRDDVRRVLRQLVGEGLVLAEGGMYCWNRPQWAGYEAARARAESKIPISINS